MTEISITIDQIDPVDFFGVNNARFLHIKRSFPRLRMVSRGNTIKAEGNEEDLQLFEAKVRQMIEHIRLHGQLDEERIERIASADHVSAAGKPEKELGMLIVTGNNGLVVRARTGNQQQMVVSSQQNDILFAIGPAGTGKTYTAVALAVKALKEKTVRKIILTRPAVEAGESLGFLPGDLKEKIDPYLRPLYDALDDMIPADKLAYYMESRIIEIAPLAFMRGRTLDHAFIILDEAQNCTSLQLKMFLTRIGAHSKSIITGDPTQIDLPKMQQSGLSTAMRILSPITGIAMVQLTEEDVVRHRLVKEIIRAYDKLQQNQSDHHVH